MLRIETNRERQKKKRWGQNTNENQNDKDENNNNNDEEEEEEKKEERNYIRNMQRRLIIRKGTYFPSSSFKSYSSVKRVEGIMELLFVTAAIDFFLSSEIKYLQIVTKFS